MHLAVLSTRASLYSTRRIVDTARRRGHEVRVLDHTRCSAVLGGEGPELWHAGAPVYGVDAVIPRIGSSVTAHGAAVVRQFEVMGVMTAVRSLAIRRARDKLRALQILSRKGIAIPRTAFARRPRPVDALVEAVGGPPVILKVVEGTQGEGVVLAESLAAARAVAEAFNHVNTSFIVQEYIAEARGQDLRAFVVDGFVVAAMQRTAAEGEFRANLHQGGASAPVELSAAEREMATRAARFLGLSICGVDLLRSDRGPLLLEVNASPGLEGIERSSGVDVAAQILASVEARWARVREHD